MGVRLTPSVVPSSPNLTPEIQWSQLASPEGFYAKAAAHTLQESIQAKEKFTNIWAFLSSGEALRKYQKPNACMSFVNFSMVVSEFLSLTDGAHMEVRISFILSISKGRLWSKYGMQWSPMKELQSAANFRHLVSVYISSSRTQKTYL